MSASWPGSMRGPRVKTPLLLLLLLLLLNALTSTVRCQDEDEGADDGGEPEEAGDPEAAADQVTPEEAEETEETGESPPSDPPPTVPQTSSSPDQPPIEGVLPDEVTTTPDTDPGSGSGSGSGEFPPEISDEDEGLSPIIILIPVVLVVVIIGMIVCGIFINRRWNNKAKSQELNKEDPYLDGSSTEKVPMPMFEEDVPSVLELEMEELDQWMRKDYEAAEDSNLA